MKLQKAQKDFLQQLNKAEHTPISCYQVARCYEAGLGTPVDKEKAHLWYEKAFENDGLSFIVTLAESGDAEALFIMGCLCEAGRAELPIDYSQAVQFYTKSALQAYIPAQSKLGYMYADGRGTIQDDIESLKWFRLAAEQGDVGAKLRLARLANDSIKHLQILAEEEGDASAAFLLGYHYYRYYSKVAEDHVEAVKWLLIAAEQGNRQAEDTLYDIKYHSSDAAKAAANAALENSEVFLLRSANRKNAHAQWRLGYLYLQGTVLEQNTPMGLHWIRAVAEGNSQLRPVARLAMGFLLTTGCADILPEGIAAMSWAYEMQHQDAVACSALLETLNLMEQEKKINDTFYLCLLGFFHECNLSQKADHALESARYYHDATLMHQDIFAQSAQRALKRMESAIKAYRFQQLVAQQAKQQRQQHHYQADDLELKTRILSLSTKDALDELLDQQPSFSLKAVNEGLPALIEWVKHARTLIQRRAYAYPVAVQAIQAHQHQSLLQHFFNPAPSSPSVIFQQQKMYFWEKIIPKQRKQLQRWLKLKPLSVGQTQFLAALLNYLGKLSSLCQTRTIEPVLIHESTQGTRLLAPEFAAKLLPEGELVSDVKQGSHPVIILQGIHYKCATAGIVSIAPGIEYMVDRLNKLIIGHGSAPTTLLKVTQGRRQIIYQASKTVTGSDLQYILDKNPEYLNYLDKDNFSAMTILGILTNPQDGKADNYMVEVEADYDEAGNERIKALHIVGIDNDMAFGKSVEHKYYSNGEEYFSSEVRNVLFLFPQMHHALSDTFRTQFLECSPELLIIEWLILLAERNKEYDQLLRQGIFTPADFCGVDSTDKGLQLPILLAFGLTRTIYRKLVKLQAYLRQNPLATHHQLLEHVEPVIAVLYARMRIKYPDILEGLSQIYECSLGENLKSLLSHQVGDFYTVASRLIYQSALNQTRELTIAQAVEELMLEINWPALPEEMGKEIINALEKASLQSPTELLHQLVSKKNMTSQLMSFLLRRKASLSGFSELRGYHILHTAVRSYSVEIIQLLLQIGADVNAKDDAGETPLDKLVKEAEPHLATIQYLIDNNAKTSGAAYDQTLREILSNQNIIIINVEKSQSSSNEVSQQKIGSVNQNNNQKSPVPPKRLQFLKQSQEMDFVLLPSCSDRVVERRTP